MLCATCKYWEDAGRVGECHRYPEALAKFPTHWCGEYINRNVGISKEIQVYNIYTDKNEIQHNVDNAFGSVQHNIEEIDTPIETQSKRGRPRKL